jgi:hypothetical protein
MHRNREIRYDWNKGSKPPKWHEGFTYYYFILVGTLDPSGVVPAHESICVADGLRDEAALGKVNPSVWRLIGEQVRWAVKRGKVEQRANMGAS